MHPHALIDLNNRITEGKVRKGFTKDKATGLIVGSDLLSRGENILHEKLIVSLANKKNWTADNKTKAKLSTRLPKIDKFIPGDKAWPFKRDAYEALIMAGVGQEESQEAVFGNQVLLDNISLPKEYTKSSGEKGILDQATLQKKKDNFARHIMRHPEGVFSKEQLSQIVNDDKIRNSISVTYTGDGKIQIGVSDGRNDVEGIDVNGKKMIFDVAYFNDAPMFEEYEAEGVNGIYGSGKTTMKRSIHKQFVLNRTK
jgi:hypothetical protein